MTSVPREHPGSLLQTAVGWMISCEIIFKRLNCVGSNRPGILESSILFLFDWVKSIYSMAWNYASGYLRHDDTSCMSLIRTTNFTKLREVLNSLLCDAIMRHKACLIMAQAMACCHQSLPEQVLTYYHQGPVTLIWEQFHKRHLSHQSVKLAWN